MATESLQTATPQPIMPIAIIEAVTELRSQLQRREPAGRAFPGCIKGSRVQRAPNIAIPDEPRRFSS